MPANAALAACSPRWSSSNGPRTALNHKRRTRNLNDEPGTANSNRTPNQGLTPLPRTYCIVSLMSLRLGFDVDGVLADFRSAFRATARECLGRAAAGDGTDGDKPVADRAARRRQGVGPHRANPELVDAGTAARAGRDRPPLCHGARLAMGSVLPDQAAGERRRSRPVPDAVVARAAGLLPAGGAHGAGISRASSPTRCVSISWSTIRSSTAPRSSAPDRRGRC